MTTISADEQESASASKFQNPDYITCWAEVFTTSTAPSDAPKYIKEAAELLWCENLTESELDYIAYKNREEHEIFSIYYDASAAGRRAAEIPQSQWEKPEPHLEATQEKDLDVRAANRRKPPYTRLGTLVSRFREKGFRFGFLIAFSKIHPNTSSVVSDYHRDYQLGKYLGYHELAWEISYRMLEKGLDDEQIMTYTELNRLEMSLVHGDVFYNYWQDIKADVDSLNLVQLKELRTFLDSAFATNPKS